MAVNLRASQALTLWHNVNTRLVLDGGIDLSYRQLSILLAIYMQPPPHSVKALAAALNVTKPVITRALDTMGKQNLVTRKRDEADRRNVIIQRTVDGALYVEKIGDILRDEAKKLPL